jgi:hypothetical protein
MMKNLALMASCTLLSTVAIADDVSETNRLLCSQSQVMLCLHSADCAFVPPAEVATPQFVIIDTRKKIVSTTKASGDGRSSDIGNLTRDGGLIMAQGRQGERAFSFVIDEATGTFTGSVASDGYTINAFGACTDARVD